MKKIIRKIVSSAPWCSPGAKLLAPVLQTAPGGFDKNSFNLCSSAPDRSTGFAKNRFKPLLQCSRPLQGFLAKLFSDKKTAPLELFRWGGALFEFSSICSICSTHIFNNKGNKRRIYRALKGVYTRAREVEHLERKGNIR